MNNCLHLEDKKIRKGLEKAIKEYIHRIIIYEALFGNCNKNFGK